MSTPPALSPLYFPAEVEAAANMHGLSPALAFGLGEGLNLFYTRRAGEIPPHRLHVLPGHFPARLVERLALPRPVALRAALVGNAHGVMICTGDWHGLDAIEKWGEELPFWYTLEGWETSLAAAADLIEASDGLYRRAYVGFLDEAMTQLDGLDAPRRLLDEIADEWLDIAPPLRGGHNLERLSSRVRRMAGRESRFWGGILDRFGIVNDE